MRCPNCGTHNGKTNKYCRDCGTRLDVIVPKEARQEADEDRKEELKLGEELFAVHELLDADDLEAALEKGARLATDNPDSASAHAIVALVCERLAEKLTKQGEPQRAKEFLKLAIARYETVIDLNPDSAADREKLASLRLQSMGQAAVTPPAPEPKTSLAIIMDAVPKPLLAASAAFIVMLVIVIVFTTAPKKQPATSEVVQPEQQPVAVPATQPDAPPLSIYTFPSATAQNQPPLPAEPVQQAPSGQTQTPQSTEVRPVQVPKVDQELTLVPEAKKTQPSTSEPEPAKPTPTPQPPAPEPSGDSQLAEAIRLHNQGRNSDAIITANNAIALFNRDIQDGRGVDSAKRGIENARKLISVWQQTR